MKSQRILEFCRVQPGQRVNLDKFKTDWAGGDDLQDLTKDELKERAKALVADRLRALTEAQELLYANDRFAVLVILQAMDAAGKDGIIKHAMSGLNPQGCQVFSFKRPSEEELDHDFLWRCCLRLPERGRIGIFNRSYYEEVLVVKVHPELLERQKLPPGPRDKDFWRTRYDSINDLEKHLVRNGTRVVKFFLHLSKQEQKQRFLARLDDPRKHWKFSLGDLDERDRWNDYLRAYEDALEATSTRWAPWHIVPADHKWVARAIVATLLADAIHGLKLKPLQISAEQARQLKLARRRLENE